MIVYLFLYFLSTKRTKSTVRYAVTCLNERVDVQHERLSPADDELIHAGDGVRPATQ